MQPVIETGSHLMQNYSRWPIALTKGSGNRVWDLHGNAYLDFTSGIAVTSLGHVPPLVTKRLHEQLDLLWHSSNLFQHPLQEVLAAKLAALSGLPRAFFCNSGAEANEAAIKIARRYAQSVKKENRWEVITFTQSFHGRTLATLTATGQDKVKEGFLPLPEGFRTVPFNDLQALEEAISPATCAVMLELVQGEGGVVPADPEWVKGIRDLCDRHGLLLIADEIQTGMGRTGTWFAFQQYGVRPDVVSLAKGLGSGFPVGAILATEEVAQAFSAGAHGSTFGGNPLAMTAAIATIDEMMERDVLRRVNHLHSVLMEQLGHLQKEYSSLVLEVRGKGLLIGMVCSRPVADLLAALQKRGVLLLQAGTHVVRFLPSFVTTEEEVSEMIDALRESLREWSVQES